MSEANGTPTNTFPNEETPERLEVTLPHYAGRYFVRVLSGEERLAFEDWNEERKDRGETRAGTFEYMLKLVVMTTTNEKNELLFTDDHIPALRHANSKALLKIARRSMRLNMITADDVEELAGKSRPADTASSSTGLQPT